MEEKATELRSECTDAMRHLCVFVRPRSSYKSGICNAFHWLITLKLHSAALQTNREGEIKCQCLFSYINRDSGVTLFVIIVFLCEQQGVVSK